MGRHNLQPEGGGAVGDPLGPPTAQQRIVQLEQRVEEIGGVLASVRMACQQQFLVYGRKGQRFDAAGVSQTFKAIRDLAGSDPAGRDKPPDFTRPWRAMQQQQRRPSLVRDAIRDAIAAGR